MQKRKTEHIRICLEEEVEVGAAGFERLRFVHNALPEIDFGKIDTSTEFFGKKLLAPVLVSSMTGGTREGGGINKNLAAAAQKMGIAMAVGSQRVAIVNPKTASTFRIRELAPDILLFANIGAVQLNYGFSVNECQRAVEMIGADALVLHLNPLQEAIQPEGNINFDNLLPKIEQVVKGLSVPVVVKEVGFGISQDVAARLCSVGVKAIETAGWGGTNWAKIEGFRRAKVEGQSRLSDLFSEWGILTSESIVQCKTVKGARIIGSGGVRNGIEMAKTIALGADLVGMALPFLRPAIKSAEAVEECLETLIGELKVAMFCTGSQNIQQLKRVTLEKIE